ncbi:MAG: hypothetical protein HUU28_09050, partial [Planctomycetaceae bacterium]|nr:hypothetical protein [Planctomycetaceae bacterium]
MPAALLALLATLAQKPEPKGQEPGKDKQPEAVQLERTTPAQLAVEAGRRALAEK